MYPEYESSVRDYMDEMQQWYCDKVGATFSMKPLQVVRTAEDYQTVRCGPNPSQNCLDDPSKLESDMPFYVNKAVHGGVVGWEQQVSALAFVAGGGGWAGSVDDANYTSWAIVGDWVLEPISGVENTWGIPCQYSGGWQCAGGVPKGTPAHELGHTFGLDHPSAEGSIIKWHGDYPNVGFLSSEVEFLKDSPFFQ
ncbi:hypothetical protein CMO96_04270 [Candidatus Woesebacteria bacterium]|nr:hypothetical protein [Candidatus Woesebacteria bacterium]|tara:strand:+ start:394 stop:978 length:585 start_codon:yes stop_codon:yes gene_type:complete